MNVERLTQFLIDITRGSLKEAYARDPAQVIEAAALTAQWREALRSKDVGALWSAGAHPMALMYFARAAGWDNERYYGCLAAAGPRRGEVRTGGPAGSAPVASPAQPQTRR